MRRFLPLLACLALGYLAAQGFAKDEKPRNIYGAFPSHELVERFRISVGMTTGGRPVRDAERLQAREQLNLPDFYGSLVSITGDNSVVVLWFRGSGGAIRNVILERPANDMYFIVPTPTRDFRQELYP